MNTAGALTVSVDGREVAITCIHVGVDLPRVQQALDTRSLFSPSRPSKYYLTDFKAVP